MVVWHLTPAANPMNGSNPFAWVLPTPDIEPFFRVSLFVWRSSLLQVLFNWKFYRRYFFLGIEGK